MKYKYSKFVTWYSQWNLLENLLKILYFHMPNLHHLFTFSTCLQKKFELAVGESRLLTCFFFHFLKLMFEYSCHHFPSPLSPALPVPNSHPQSQPPLVPSMSPSFMFIYVPFPSFPCYFLLPSPLVTVSLLSISMSLTIFCLPVCFAN